MSICDSKSSESCAQEDDKSNPSQVFSIHLIPVAQPESSNESRTVKSVNYLDQDLSCSKIQSLNSPLLTEELIINENIDFLMSISSSSSSISLNYTKTDLASRISSIFPSFEGSNVLFSSLPQSNNESISLNRKSFESMDIRPFSTKNESKFPYLKIPHFSQDFITNPFKLSLDIAGKNDKTPIVNVMPADLDASPDSPCFRDRDMMSPRLSEVVFLERQTNLCSCAWCCIM